MRRRRASIRLPEQSRGKANVPRKKKASHRGSPFYFVRRLEWQLFFLAADQNRLGLRRFLLVARVCHWSGSRLGRPDHAVARTVLALVVRSTWIPLGKPVVPHPSTAFRAADDLQV